MDLSFLTRFWRPALVIVAVLVVLGFARSFIGNRISWETYTSKDPAFSIQYPKDTDVQTNYVDPLAPEYLRVSGVNFVLPKKLSVGSTVVYAAVAVEYAKTDACDAQLFLPAATTTRSVTKGGREYSVASILYADSSRASQERVFALPDSNPCIAVHTTLQLDPRAVNNPDAPLSQQKTAAATGDAGKWAVLATFDSMLQSLSIK